MIVDVNAAILCDRLDWLHDLLVLGVSPNVRSAELCSLHEDATALMAAAFWKRLSIAEALLGSGARANAIDAKGWNTLAHAIYPRGHVTVGGVERKPDAAVSIVRLLADHGADLHHPTQFRWTPFMFAVMWGSAFRPCRFSSAKRCTLRQARASS